MKEKENEDEILGRLRLGKSTKGRDRLRVLYEIFTPIITNIFFSKAKDCAGECTAGGHSPSLSGEGDYLGLRQRHSDLGFACA